MSGPESAARAPARPDVYTLLTGSMGPLAVNATPYRKMPYDSLKDLTRITLVGDVMAGDQVQCMFATLPSSIAHVRAAKLRALAVASVEASGATLH